MLPVAQDLLELQSDAMRTGRNFLVTRNNSAAALEAVKEQIREILALVHPPLELRSIRRGGLQEIMRQPGATIEKCLLFSRHQSADMLRRYLDHGALAHDEAAAMTAISTSMAACME